MKYTGKCHDHTGFHVPFKQEASERDIPFIIDLKGKKNSCEGCKQECKGQDRIP